MTKPTVNVTRFSKDMDGSMDPADDGEWIRYSDFDALSAQVRELREDNIGLLDILASCGLGEDQAKEMLTLKQSLATAREGALEEAAKLCDEQVKAWNSNRITARARQAEAEVLALKIRALKPTTEAGGGIIMPHLIPCGCLFVAHTKEVHRVCDYHARLSSPSVPEGELLERINRHIGQLSPHIKERETARLLIAAYEALLVSESPKDLPSRFRAVWNDGFHAYTKEQLAWVFFQKGAESMLAHPPEAGKVQDDEALLAEYTDIRKKLLWGATTTTSEFDIFKAGYKYAMESVTGVGPASTTGAPSCRETQVRSLPDSAPSPVAQGAGVTLAEHTKHVSDFLNELYATMIDPCAEGTMTVKETCDALLKAAVDQREQLALRHLSHPTGSDWKPIESAPKDGTPIQGCWFVRGINEWIQCTVIWTPGGGWAQSLDPYKKWTQCGPTLWQPLLPAPPKPTAREGGEL
jgi:hypothetical protein